MTFNEYQRIEHNYECITTFWDDFSVADCFGMDAVKDTFRRAFREWKSNYKYLTELVLVLNHRCWMHYNNGHKQLSALYSDLYYEARNYAVHNLTGEQMDYFFEITD